MGNLETLPSTALSHQPERQYAATVVCLKAFDAGEADRVLHLYSREHGLIHAIAKGIRRPGSRLGGAAERMAVNAMLLTRGQSLDVVSQYENRRSFSALHADILKLAYVSLFAELLMAIGTPHDDCSEGLFDALVDGLGRMAKAEDGMVAYEAAVFQMVTLGWSGYQPCLARCVITDDPLPWEAPEPFYPFSAEAGGVLMPEMRGQLPDSQVVNVSTPTLRCLETLNPQDWLAADPVKVQKFLGYYWAHRLHRPLQTLPFVLQLLETGG
ncbi:MAG: DNA repair protein RecO [Candidatus Melainabacteria bacterium]